MKTNLFSNNLFLTKRSTPTKMRARTHTHSRGSFFPTNDHFNTNIKEKGKTTRLSRMFIPHHGSSPRPLKGGFSAQLHPTLQCGPPRHSMTSIASLTGRCTQPRRRWKPHDNVSWVSQSGKKKTTRQEEKQRPGQVGELGEGDLVRSRPSGAARGWKRGGPGGKGLAGAGIGAARAPGGGQEVVAWSRRVARPVLPRVARRWLRGPTGERAALAPRGGPEVAPGPAYSPPGSGQSPAGGDPSCPPRGPASERACPLGALLLRPSPRSTTSSPQSPFRRLGFCRRGRPAGPLHFLSLPRLSPRPPRRSPIGAAAPGSRASYWACSGRTRMLSGSAAVVPSASGLRRCP